MEYYKKQQAHNGIELAVDSSSSSNSEFEFELESTRVRVDSNNKKHFHSKVGEKKIQEEQDFNLSSLYEINKPQRRI